MLKNKNVYVKPPIKCPGCGDLNDPYLQTYLGSMYGAPSIWGIKDSEIPSKWVIIKGWICDDGKDRTVVCFGTAIQRGPVDEETEPQDIIEHDCVYIVAKCDGNPKSVMGYSRYFPNRTFFEEKGRCMTGEDEFFFDM